MKALKITVLDSDHCKILLQTFFYNVFFSWIAHSLNLWPVTISFLVTGIKQTVKSMTMLRINQCPILKSGWPSMTQKPAIVPADAVAVEIAPGV